MSVPGWPDLFRGSDAIAAELVTRGVLRGPRFRCLLPDTYAQAGAEPDLALRSHAAFRWSRGRGVLSGYSAAEVLRAPCAPFGAAAELTVAEDVLRSQHMLGVEDDGRDHLDPDQLLKDIERHTRLPAAGWRVLRYTARDIRRDPGRIVREVTSALA